MSSRSVPGIAKVEMPVRRELSIPTELKEQERLLGGVHVMRRDGLIVCPAKKFTEEAKEAYSYDVLVARGCIP